MFSYYTYQPDKNEENKLYTFLDALDMRAENVNQRPEIFKKKEEQHIHGSLNNLKKGDDKIH